VMPVDAAQARDVVLFLMSIGRRSGADLTNAAFRIYRQGIRPGVDAELQRVARSARPLTGVLGRTLARSGNRDLIGLVRALVALADKG
jgi:hypothetical protein